MYSYQNQKLKLATRNDDTPFVFKKIPEITNKILKINFFHFSRDFPNFFYIFHDTCKKSRKIPELSMMFS
jgi:hypothetical protein